MGIKSLLFSKKRLILKMWKGNSSTKHLLSEYGVIVIVCNSKRSIYRVETFFLPSSLQSWWYRNDISQKYYSFLFPCFSFYRGEVGTRGWVSSTSLVSFIELLKFLLFVSLHRLCNIWFARFCKDNLWRQRQKMCEPSRRVGGENKTFGCREEGYFWLTVVLRVNPSTGNDDRCFTSEEVYKILHLCTPYRS